MDSNMMSSIGMCRVVVDKNPGSDIITVIPVEALQKIEGDIKDYSLDQLGSVATAVVSASWYDKGGGQRDSAPDVVVGEEVNLYRYADAEGYYWSSTGRDPILRKTEHIEYSLANSEKHDEEPNDDNQMQLIVSTRDGYIKLTTPSNRGEPVVYIISLDYANEGVLNISDDHDNLIRLDSLERKFTLRTSEVLVDCDHMTVTGKVTILGATDIQNTLFVTKTITAIKDIISSANVKCKKVFNTWASSPNKKNK